MRIKILSLGNIKDNFILDGEAQYLKRLRPILNLNIIEISTKKLAALPPAERMKKEGQLLLEKLDPKDFLIILDENGKPTGSAQFSVFLEKHMNSSSTNAVFAIGGVFGWDKSIRERANYSLSLSSMTFTFQMTRLILIEQIYRAMTIMKNIPYHKA